MRYSGRAKALLALGAVAGLSLPAPAQAATRTVEAGPFTKKAQKAFQEDAVADANAFFRRVVTIRRGDRVSWEINGFHTVTFVPRGGVAPLLVVPDSDNPVTGVNDAGGAPFWFNGEPRLLFNPTVVARQGGDTFRPSVLHNSGLGEDDGPPPPYRLRFNRTGRFPYICSIHPGMKGTVRVVGRNRSIPSAKQNNRQARREQRVLLRQAQRLTSGIGTSRLVDTAQAGNDRRSGVAIFKFFPTNLEVKTNTTVRLRMSPGSTEVHTFSFGPTNGKDAYLDTLAENLLVPEPVAGGPPNLVFDPRAAYPSEDPKLGVVPDYTGANHGNGFYNAGVLDRARRTAAPAEVRLRFTQAGAYDYICLIHPFMKGRVTVTD